MINNYLSIDDLNLQSQCNDWEEMIRATGDMMFDLGYISRSYIDAMVSAKEKYGAYMVVAPHVALLHARPEDGVKKTGVVILTSEKDIIFGSEYDPVRIGIGFAAVNPNDHIEILQDLACLIQNEEAIDGLVYFKAGEESELMKFLLSLELASDDCI